MKALERVKRAAEPGASPYNCYPSDLLKLLAVVEAAQELYRNTADYITRNNLGDVHHNRDMQMARDALAALTEDTTP